jgi:hypothetical protein
MKAFSNFLLLLSLSVSLQAQAQDATVAAEPSYDPIEDTCNHPVLLSAAAFASNFFCENVLKVAVDDMDCDVLQFRVLEAQAQIIAGANFRQTIALVDEDRRCVIAFHSKVNMPLPHTGQEPVVDMDEVEALPCEIELYDDCLQHLTIIDPYWEEDIENGGGELVPTTEAEWEKEAEEEEEIIETVEKDLVESGISGVNVTNFTSSPGNHTSLTNGEDDTADSENLQINATSPPANNSSPTNNGEDVLAAESLEINSTSLPATAASIPANTTPPTSGLNAQDSESPGVNTSSLPASETLGVNGTSVPETATPPNAVAQTNLSAFLQPNSNATPAEALADQAINDLIGKFLQSNASIGEQESEVEELVADMKEEIEEEITQFEEQMEAEEMSGPYETEDLEEFEDEATWAFAGKTDECSRFGVSPAEGIAFKCGTVSRTTETEYQAISNI